MMLLYYAKHIRSKCDGAVINIHLDHKLQWPQEGLSCEPFAYEVVT